MARAVPLLAFALAAAALFAWISAHPIGDRPEGAYAEVAREMAASGDIATPRLDGIRYGGTPPPAFLPAASSIRALGATEFAVRLPGALAALACALAVLLVARHAFGPRTGAPAGLLAATTPLVALFSRVGTPEMLFAALVTGALAAAYSALSSPATPSRRLPGVLFFGLTAFAFFCAGPVALAIPLGTVLLFTAAARDATLLRGWRSRRRP